MHYDNSDKLDKEKRCTSSALGDALKANGVPVGDLGTRHRMMRGPTSGDVLHDYRLSLFEGEPGYILGKSFVIEQGNSEGDWRCATVYPAAEVDVPSGLVPCVKHDYADCLVGSLGSPGRCVFTNCEGYAQNWTTVLDTKTDFCRQVAEVYPKMEDESVAREGEVDCALGKHTLLKLSQRKKK